MQIQCDNCHALIGNPQSPTGVYTLLPAGLLAILLVVYEVAYVHPFFDVWTALLVGCGAALPLWTLFAVLVWEVTRWGAFLYYRSERCANCGTRYIGRPRYFGF